MVVVYLEIVWLLNFMIDWMILLLTQSITKYMTKWFRIVLASFFGSVIVPISFLFPAFPIDMLGVKVAHSFLIIFIAFGFRNVATYLKVVCTFYFMTFSIGGGLFAIHYLFSTDSLFAQVNMQSDQIHGLFVLIGFPIIYYFTKIRMDKHKLEQFQQEFFYRVHIKWKERQVETTGYLDSGNHLVDPLTQTPVIIVDETVLLHWFTEEEVSQLHTTSQDLTNDGVDQFSPVTFRMLPFQGVGGNVDFMLAFKPDLFLIEVNGSKQTFKKVLIGIKFGTLVADDSYHCLLHPKLFQHVG
ncbi:sigma-E processing peptidase SpoIIGA [Gracilibacillus sp. S3-1-1]|uniref:Sigma-E processing peptidase SpoIIGA n=1 Tax=Gracilibacillus pellucidus TaxID=3095368 RepID=A0ACC6M1W7_9BACI|nr:sigma-E processing peptidase SpoIIGA [Gracilibacillus sp. S3-1-1]MDX8044936.1 sigma-E processing peptidase SpoIIGA [Gracilibacillus sp. S3-1-1]